MLTPLNDPVFQSVSGLSQCKWSRGWAVALWSEHVIKVSVAGRLALPSPPLAWKKEVSVAPTATGTHRAGGSLPSQASEGNPTPVPTATASATADKDRLRARGLLASDTER